MRAHPKVSIPTGRPSSIQEPTSSSASHPVLILQRNRNTTLNINRQAAQSHAKPIDTPKPTTGHWTALQREEIQLHPPGHRHKFPETKKLSQTAGPTPPTGADSTIKRNYDLQPAERRPQTLQTKQNERQRNIQQLREHDKKPSKPNKRRK